jgi:hypothetical protein
LIEIFDKKNSITSIGTLLYLDSMSKNGFATIPCNYKLLMKNDFQVATASYDHYLNKFKELLDELFKTS